MFAERPNPQTPILLLVDDFSGHWTAKVNAYAASIGVHLLKVPPSYTAVCQPADIAWNRPFKAHLRAQWVASLREQLAKHTGDDRFKMIAPKRGDIAAWIHTSWEKLTREESLEPVIFLDFTIAFTKDRNCT